MEAAESPGNKPHICEHCAASFRSSYHLRRHVLIHTGIIFSRFLMPCFMTFFDNGTKRKHCLYYASWRKQYKTILSLLLVQFIQHYFQVVLSSEVNTVLCIIFRLLEMIPGLEHHRCRASPWTSIQIIIWEAESLPFFYCIVVHRASRDNSMARCKLLQIKSQNHITVQETEGSTTHFC